MATWASKSLIPWSAALWPWVGQSSGSMVGASAVAPVMAGAIAVAATMRAS